MNYYGIPWLDRFVGTPLEAQALRMFEQRQEIEKQANAIEAALSMPIDADDRDPAQAKAQREADRQQAYQELAEMQAKLVAQSQQLEDEFVEFRRQQAYAPDWQAMSKGLDSLDEYMLDEQIAKALDAGDIDEALELIKGAGHKYIKRIPTGNPKRPYHYVYRVTSKHARSDPKVGEKVKVAHGDKQGHYEITKRDGDQVTVRHDESGHEMTVSASKLHDLFADEHKESIDAAHKRLARTHEAAQRFGSEKQKARAKKMLDEHRQKYGYAEPAGEGKPKPGKDTGPKPKATEAGRTVQEAAKGKVRELVGVAKKQTEQRRAREAARDNEAKEHTEGMTQDQAFGAYTNMRMAELDNAPHGTVERALTFGPKDLDAMARWYAGKVKDDPKDRVALDMLNSFMHAQRLQSGKLSPGSALHRKALAYAKKGLPDFAVLPDGANNDNTPYILQDARAYVAKQQAKKAPEKPAEAPKEAAQPKPKAEPKAAAKEATEWNPGLDRGAIRKRLDAMPEGTVITWLDESGYHETRFEKKGNTWHEAGGEKAQSRDIARELIEASESRPGRYVEGKQVVSAKVTVRPPGYYDAEPKAKAAAPAAAAAAAKKAPTASMAFKPQTSNFAPSKATMKEAQKGTTYKWTQYGRQHEVEKVGAGKWEERIDGEVARQTTTAGIHIPNAPEGGVETHKLGEAAARKAGVSLAELHAKIEGKHADLVNKSIRTGPKAKMGQLQSRWKGNTNAVQKGGKTYYTNGHIVVAAEHLSPGDKKKLDGYVKDTTREVTAKMLDNILPKKTDIAYHYVGPHPRSVGDNDNPVAVYRSDDGKHVMAVNAHYSPPATLYGAGNQRATKNSPARMNASPVVADPDEPLAHLLMPVAYHAPGDLEELQGIAKQLAETGGGAAQKSLTGLQSLGEYLDSGDAATLEKADMKDDRQLELFKADDGKPGESLEETSTSELQDTLTDIKARLKDKPDAEGLKARHEAIAAELKRRGEHKETMSKGIADLGDYLRKSGAMPAHEAKMGAPKSAAIEGGSADGGELAGVGTTGGSGDSAPVAGTGKDGLPTGAPKPKKEKWSEDDADEDKQMSDRKGSLEQSITRKSLTPAAQREMMAYEHAKRVGELTKSEPDVQVGGRPHPLSHTAVHGNTDRYATELLKSEFYYGPPPTIAPPESVLRSSVLCKSDACGQRYMATLTACPWCGDGTTQNRMLPKGGYVGATGQSAVILTKSNEPLLRRPPEEQDLYFPGEE